jgi:hypothetical protein
VNEEGAELCGYHVPKVGWPGGPSPGLLNKAGSNLTALFRLAQHLVFIAATIACVHICIFASDTLRVLFVICCSVH